jgi:beta-glucanase (GH16 family)
MLPKNSVYGDWPRSGEIDIVESKGNDEYNDSNGVNMGNTLMGSTLHWGPGPNYDKYLMTHWEK